MKKILCFFGFHKNKIKKGFAAQKGTSNFVIPCIEISCKFCNKSKLILN